MRIYVDGSNMLTGTIFIISYTPAYDIDSLRLVIAIIAICGMILVWIDTSNALKNIIYDPRK